MKIAQLVRGLPMACILLCALAPALPAEGSGAAAALRETQVDYQLTVLWFDAKDINAHTQSGFGSIDPLLGHGLSFGSDLGPLLGGTFCMGAHILGAYEDNASSGGADRYGLATGGYWVAARWRFFDFLDSVPASALPAASSSSPRGRGRRTWTATSATSPR